MNQKVGVIGLGNAGGAVAGALARSVAVCGFDIDPQRLSVVRDLGVDCLASVSAVAAQADCVLLSLPKPEISVAVIQTLIAGETAPGLVIETSTVTPIVATACRDLCRPRGIAYVDAAIAGGVASMAAGAITFFLGGDDDDKTMARPVLELVATRIHDLGPAGAGMGAKVVNNAIMHAVMVVLIEAFTMSDRIGIDSKTMIEILNREEGLLRPLVHRVQERMLEGNYDGGMSVSNARKDSVLALETAQRLGVPLFAILAAHTPYEIAAASGMGDLDYAAVATLWESWAGVDFTTRR